MTRRLRNRSSVGEIIFLCLVAAKSVAPWAGMWRSYPEIPFSLFPLYLHGEAGYYTMISSLARLNFGESIVYELNGAGIKSFPFFGVMIHAALFKLFGVAGLLLTDILISVALYKALELTLRSFHVRPVTAKAVGLLAATGGLWFLLPIGENALDLAARSQHFAARLLPFGDQLPLLPGNLSLSFWGPRIFRPFVSDIFLLLSIYALARLYVSRDSGIQARYWFLLGFSHGAIMQADPYSSAAVGMSHECSGCRRAGSDRQRGPAERSEGYRLLLDGSGRHHGPVRSSACL